MISIVIVSHSQALAGALVELALQMAQKPVPIAIAAGIDDPEHLFGTDVIAIQKAIASVYTDDGVLILMDLGSALLSAEMALEFLPDNQREKVKLCSAPLVEGAIAAIVQASTGAPLEAVITEATTALNSKITHLSPEPPEAIALIPSHEQLFPPETLNILVKNPLGIHARPAAQFVSTCAQFEAMITVENLSTHSQPINGKSINQMITLGVRQGQEIKITAQGEDSKLALNALADLVEHYFGENPNLEPAELRKCENMGSNATLTGIPTSEGLSTGVLIPYHPSLPEVAPQTCPNPQPEWQQLQLALQTAKHQIQQVMQTTANCEIFQAHLLYLEDPSILHQVHHQIFTEQKNAAWAWKRIIEETTASYSTLEDPYLQARAMDVLDVGGRVLRLLTGNPTQRVHLSRPGILVAQDLTPSEVAQFKNTQVLGICTVAGSPTSHSSLIANMIGIPMIVGVGTKLLELAPETPLAINGKTGEIWVNPSEELGLTSHPLIISEPQEAITQDGHKISVVANILGAADAQFAMDAGAEGVGVLRTELLYLDRLNAPTEDEQTEIYREIAKIINPYPLTIRTLDIGGDKPVPYLTLEREANPFLGWRGIRQSLDCREMFKTQLKAILRAGVGTNIRIMFPMVASVAEVQTAKAIFRAAKRELKAENMAFDDQLSLGVMIEVPAAVTMADKLALEVDFLSIGTNDLSQYIMAADRTNPKVSKLADAFDPAVLRMIHQGILAGHKQNLKVSVCGQIASDPEAVPLLLGLGTDELSINPPAIPKIKQIISQVNLQDAKKLAQQVLQLESVEMVKMFLKDLIG